MKLKSLSRVWLFATPCPWDSPGKNPGVGCHFLPNAGIEPRSPTLQAGSLLSEPPEAQLYLNGLLNTRFTFLSFLKLHGTRTDAPSLCSLKGDSTHISEICYYSGYQEHKMSSFHLLWHYILLILMFDYNFTDNKSK